MNNIELTTLEISKLINKSHNYIISDVDAMVEETGTKLTHPTATYKDTSGNDNLMYVLNGEEIYSFIGKYRAHLRMRIIKQLHRLQDANKPEPLTFNEALELATKQAEALGGGEHE